LTLPNGWLPCEELEPQRPDGSILNGWNPLETPHDHPPDRPPK
jgi:hypothetical protein